MTHVRFKAFDQEHKISFQEKLDFCEVLKEIREISPTAILLEFTHDKEVQSWDSVVMGFSKKVIQDKIEEIKKKIK